MRGMIERKKIIVILLLSGLIFHDLLVFSTFKIGIITITYLRIVLVIAVSCFIFSTVTIFRKDYFALGILAFMLYGLFRIGSNVRIAFSMYCPLFAFFLLYIFIDNFELLESCIDFLAFSLIVLCILGCFEILTGVHFGENYFETAYGTSSVKMLAVGMYYNENDFSALLTVLIIYMLLSRFHWGIKGFSILAATLIILINGSEICLLGLALMGAVAFITYKKSYSITRLCMVLAAIYFVLDYIIEVIKSTSINYRMYMYSYGLKNCLAHFWWGTGIGNYSNGMIEVGYKPLGHTSTDPHNLFLELWGQFGVVWVVLFVFLLGYLMWRFYKQESCKERVKYLGLFTVIPFIGLASSSCLEKNYIYLAILIPCVYYRLARTKKSNVKIYYL